MHSASFYHESTLMSKTKQHQWFRKVRVALCILKTGFKQTSVQHWYAKLFLLGVRNLHGHTVTLAVRGGAPQTRH